MVDEVTKQYEDDLMQHQVELYNKELNDQDLSQLGEDKNLVASQGA